MNIFKLRLAILKLLSPIIRILGKIHAPFSRKKIKSHHYFEARKVIKPGDVLLSTIYGELSNIGIQGKFKHAAIYFGGETEEIIEAVGSGVRRTDLVEFMLKKDVIAIMRPKFLDEEKARIASTYAQLAVGAPYDILFTVGNDAFYCSELIQWCYAKVSEEITFTRRDVFGQLTVLPDDFWLATKKFDIVWKSFQ